MHIAQPKRQLMRVEIFDETSYINFYHHNRPRARLQRLNFLVAEKQIP